jgi:hypothetical protein
VLLALASLAPAAAIWAAALANSLGLAHRLALLPAPATATSRPEILLLMDAFLTVTLVLPILAVLAAVLATISIELRITNWELPPACVSQRPRTRAQLATLLLLLVGAALSMAMAGHLMADCVFGRDCVPA